MGRIKVPEWISQGPQDFEYKSYRLLSEIERLRSMLYSGNLFDALNEVDANLDYFYMYDAERIIKQEDPSNYDLIGIDFQNFQLIFDQDPNINKEEVLDQLCDLAIDKFEDLHQEIRTIWRSIEESIECVYVPSKGYFLTDGFVFIVTPNNKLHIYYFHKPLKFNSTSWKDFKMQHMQSEDYTKESYLKHISEILNNNSDRTIIKVICKKDTRIEGNAIAVIQNKIFNLISRDFAF
jgi:hypothetical protein